MEDREGGFVCYWYGGPGSSSLIEQRRAPTAARALEWGRARTPRVQIRMPNQRVYWAGTDPRPPDIDEDWIVVSDPEP